MLVDATYVWLRTSAADDEAAQVAVDFTHERDGGRGRPSAHSRDGARYRDGPEPARRLRICPYGGQRPRITCASCGARVAVITWPAVRNLGAGGVPASCAKARARPQRNALHGGARSCAWGYAQTTPTCQIRLAGSDTGGGRRSGASRRATPPMPLPRSARVVTADRSRSGRPLPTLCGRSSLPESCRR